MKKTVRILLYIILSPILFFYFIGRIIAARLSILSAQKAISRIQPSTVDALTGYQFEDLISLVCKSQGYVTRNTPKSKDGGADIIIEKWKQKSVIQTKMYYNHTVGNRAVQEAHTAKDFFDAQNAIVITNSKFSLPAQQMANKLNVILIDGNMLKQLLKKQLLLDTMIAKNNQLTQQIT